MKESLGLSLTTKKNRRAELSIQTQKIADELKEGTLRSAEGMPETRGEIIQREINAQQCN